MKPLLQLEHIQKIYGNGGGVTRAIDDISFSVEDGEFLGIMGASGSGKTTLLNCISTIDTVSAGAIRLDGQDITRLRPKELAKFRRENLGFIFQDFNLLDTLTIGENIALALTGPGRRSHRRPGQPLGPVAPGHPGGHAPPAGGHHPHGDPRRLHRQLCPTDPLPPGRGHLLGAVPGHGQPQGVL